MNRIFSIAFALVLFYGAASCSDSQPTDSGTNKPDTTKKDTLRDSAAFVGKDYDFAKGGLQIIKIYYDQDSNDRLWKFKDEVITLMTDKPVNTAGWYLNAGDSNQDYALPAMITDSLFIYTHTAKGRWDSELGLNLSAGKWIWNNSDPDTAWIFNSSKQIVDSLTYKVKRK
jgi:hypothetical protein